MNPGKYELRVKLDKSIAFTLFFTDNNDDRKIYPLDVLCCTSEAFEKELLKFKNNFKGLTFLTITQTHDTISNPMLCTIFRTLVYTGKFKIKLQNIDVDELLADLMHCYLSKGLTFSTKTLEFTLGAEIEVLTPRY
jgi:hypothetical protein